MSQDIFISYSRRDQEFVTRLASELDAHFAGVWFDQAAIQVGEKWHDEILEGIQACKAFILVLSPDAMRSRYVREELSRAQQYQKIIFPVIYRHANWTDDFASLIKEVQTIDLQAGSYSDNFHKLVDGLIEAGAIKMATDDRPFLREPTKIPLNEVFRKALSWAWAWSLGWLVFWSATFIFLFMFILLQGKAGREDILNFLTLSMSGMIGGFAGGLIAGVSSMLTLRPYTPSIFGKHIAPTVRIWAVSGPLGMIISGVITVIMLIIGVISTQNVVPTCEPTEFAACLSQIFRDAPAQDARTIMLIIAVFFLIVIVIWFLTGMLAGWLVVRHIRRLEPGITRRQGWSVSTGWGCGAVIAAIVAALVIGIAINIFRL